jgi:Ca2+:H+ antiporter
VSASAAERTGFTAQERTVFALVGAVSILAVGARIASHSATLTFAVAAVAVAGLAYILGEATEQAGKAAGPRVAALLNASLGNLPELVIVVLTIRAGLLDVARASIAGSVLGNVLLILGFSLLVGGLRHGTLRFNSRTASVDASMLTLAVVALGVPTLFSHLSGTTVHDEKLVSDFTAGVMLVLYVAYLVFSFQRPSDRSSAPEGLRWTVQGAVVVLCVTAAATGVLSEILVSAIKPTIEDTGIGQQFIGLIIVPIVGNVAEHLAAVKVAAGGDVEFAMGISFNSGLQVALGVTGLAVLVSPLFGPSLTIVFPPLQIGLLAAAAVMAAILAGDGEANWLEGLQLISIYALAAIAFWFL